MFHKNSHLVIARFSSNLKSFRKDLDIQAKKLELKSLTDVMVKSKNVASELRMRHVPCAREVKLKTVHKEVGEGERVKMGEGMKDLLKYIRMKAHKAPETLSLITRDGKAELPRFLLLLAGALDGPAGEALVEESPVVIAPDVSSAAVAALAPLLSSGRWVVTLYSEERSF